MNSGSDPDIKRAIDLLLVPLALLLASVARNVTPVGTGTYLVPPLFYGVALVIMGIVFQAVGVYRLKQNEPFKQHIWTIGLGTTLAILGLAGVHDLVVPGNLREITRLQLLYLLVIYGGLAVGYRFFLFRWLSRNKNKSETSSEIMSGLLAPETDTTTDPAKAIAELPRRSFTMAALKMLARLYTWSATLIITLVLVGLIVNTLLEKQALQHRHEQLELEARHAELYPGLSADEVMRMLAEHYGWYEQISCQPEEQTASGRCENIYFRMDSEEHYRFVGEQADWPPDPAAYNVFVFGSSTTFGYRLPDSQTVPSYLQDIFREAGYPVNVYNFGNNNAYSSTELNDLLSLIRQGTIPDAAIFIDGLVEFSKWNDDVRLTQPSSSGQATISEIILNSEAGHLLDDLLHLSGWLVATGSGGDTGNGAAEPEPELDDSATNQGVIDRWYINRQIIEHIGQQYGIDLLFVWEPVPTYQYNLDYHSFADENSIGTISLFMRSRYGYELIQPWLSEDVNHSEHVLFLGDMLKGREENLFIDAVHYKATFANEIARRIADEFISLYADNMVSITNNTFAN